MFALIFLSLIFVFLFHQLYWRRRNLPPGPMPYPLIGNIPIMDMNNIDNQLLEMKNKYGPVMTLWLPDPNIIVSETEQLKSVFIKDGDKTFGRPEYLVNERIFGGNYGFTFSSDSFWKTQRRFAMHVLKDFGVGKPVLEDAIINQASDACAYFKKLNGNPADVSEALYTCAGNIIYQLCFGTTMSFDNIVEFRNKIIDGSEVFNHPYTFFMEIWRPLKYLDFMFGSSYRKLYEKVGDGVKLFQKQLKEHRETINFDSEPRDYVDAFLIEQRKHNPNNMDPTSEWSDLQIVASVYDMFGAGLETISNTIQMFIFYMIRDFEIQKKVHEEIDRVLGKDVIIKMSDQPKLPYLNACIQEVQRLTVFVAFNTQRRTADDLTIDGYVIPKGTTIIPQFFTVHIDENVFPEPQKYDPTRHLDKQKNFKKDDRILPFSIGKRTCLGESLGRMEVFLFISTFFQHFEFHPEDSNNLPPCEFDYSFVKAIKPFKVRVIERV